MFLLETCDTCFEVFDSRMSPAMPVCRVLVIQKKEQVY